MSELGKEIFMRIFKLSNLSALLVGLFSAICTSLLFAKPVNLYEQPKTDSKVVATIDSASNMIPILSAPGGQWMKVGDPKNGNVGWLKLSDVTNSKPGSMSTSSGFSMTEQTVPTSNGPQTFRTIQFGNGDPMGTDKAQAILQRLQKQQAEIQGVTQKMYNEYYRDMNALMQSNPAAFANTPFPPFMPVIIIPAKSGTQGIPPGAAPATVTNPVPPPAPPKNPGPQ
jgi:hypothetical protein